MSAGDYMRYLRARKGGPTPQEIEEATGVPSGAYRQIEQRYRAIGSEEDLTRLAEYFGVGLDDLTSRIEWSRKALSAALVEAVERDSAIELHLRSGHAVSGKVQWSDLGATLLRRQDGSTVVVQRHIVDRWQLSEA
ncbi:MAG: helix-turn-helix transcriptional regulator [Caldilineales bacterium]